LELIGALRIYRSVSFLPTQGNSKRSQPLSAALFGSTMKRVEDGTF